MTRSPLENTSGSTLGLAWVAALVLCACGATKGQVEPEPQPKAIESEFAGLEPLVAVQQLEACRTDGGGELQRLLREGSEEVRARAALALGRLPYPELGEEVSSALHAALADPSADVRAAAALRHRAAGRSELRGRPARGLGGSRADRARARRGGGQPPAK
jgi:hypothetical protein